jgi:hypothetical protein
MTVGKRSLRILRIIFFVSIPSAQMCISYLYVIIWAQKITVVKAVCPTM